MGQFLALELELQGCFLDHSAYTRREKFWFWPSVNFCFREKYGQIFIYNVDPLKPNLKIMTKQMWEHFYISNRTMDHSLWKFVNHNHIDKSSKHPPPTGCHRVIKLLAYRHFFWDTWYIETIIPRLLSKLNKKARSKLLQIQSCWIKIKLLMRASVPFLFCLLPNTTVSEMALELFQIKNILLLSSKIF